ncbi:hypothetical protein LWC33_07640 [Pseudonocardia sp. RS11V-5]|uniref:hypothetical protein n=1 Tax=Pseudonocardia terrae TaxID=2905831 RepID=UPI001E562453|nr:hypothetical protein [Pseudonocardia terrae]MCE3551323.1 hypothetical protein [Pseudonocardia terrae]
MTAVDRGSATLLDIPPDAQDLATVLRAAGLFVHRPDPDEYVVASATVDDDEDRPSTVRVVRDEPTGPLRVELVWAGGPTRAAALDRALAVTRSVSDRLPVADRSARAAEIDENLKGLQRRWTMPEPTALAPVLPLRLRPMRVTVDRMAAAAAAPDGEPLGSVIVSRAKADEVEVLVSGRAHDDVMSVAVAATGPDWPGSVLELTVTDGPNGSTTYVLAMLGDADVASGRVIVVARSDDPVEVTVDAQPRPIEGLNADDAPRVRRSMLGLDETALVFWLGLADRLPAGDPIAVAVLEGLE